MLMSSTTTSGCSSSALLTASNPSATSQTTSKSDWLRSSWQIAFRTASWSSTTKIRSMWRGELSALYFRPMRTCPQVLTSGRPVKTCTPFRSLQRLSSYSLSTDMEDIMAGKVLVVDDDATNRELLQEFLVDEGLEAAPDGRRSLEAFTKFLPYSVDLSRFNFFFSAAC